MQRPIFLLGPECATEWQVCRDCEYAKNQKMPDPIPLDEADPTYSIDKGKPGDLFPPCCKCQLGHLGHWQGHGGNFYPEELLPLRLFKCRMWFWLVIPGILESQAPL